MKDGKDGHNSNHDSNHIIRYMYEVNKHSKAFQKKPVGCICACVEDGYLFVGCSKANKKDVFNRKRGLSIAYERLYKAVRSYYNYEDKINIYRANIPTSMREFFATFVNKCKEKCPQLKLANEHIALDDWDKNDHAHNKEVE